MEMINGQNLTMKENIPSFSLNSVNEFPKIPVLVVALLIILGFLALNVCCASFNGIKEVSFFSYVIFTLLMGS